MASLQTRLSELITALGNDYKRYHGVYSATSAATLTPSQSYRQYQVTALAEALQFANPTPANMNAGQPIIFRVKDNGTVRALSWASYYRAVGVTLPNTTVAGKTTYIGAKWNATDTKIDVIAIAQEA